MAQPVPVNEARLQMLSMFTIRLLSIAANKQFECEPANFPYWIAPLKSESMDRILTDTTLFQTSTDKIINWEEVSLAAKERWQEPKISDLTTPRAREECLVYTKGEEGRRYFLREVRKDLCPLSAPPKGSRESDGGKFSRILDWYLSYRPKLSVKVDQPIWQVTLISRLFNYVRKDSIEEPLKLESISTKQRELIISESIKALFSNPVNVRVEHCESERVIHGCVVSLTFNPSGCFPNGLRSQSSHWL